MVVQAADKASLVLRVWYWELIFLCGLSLFLLVTCSVTTEWHLCSGCKSKHECYSQESVFFGADVEVLGIALISSVDTAACVQILEPNQPISSLQISLK